METKVTFKALDCIENIYNSSRDCHLEKSFFEAAKSDLMLLSNYLKLNDIETVLFANAFVTWFSDSSFCKVFEHFGLTSFHVLKYRESIDVLYQRDLLINKESRQKQITTFEVSQNIINAISKTEPLKIQKKRESVTEKNFVDLLEEYDTMSDKLDSNIIQSDEIQEYIVTLCAENLDLPVFREIKNYQLDTFETYFFLDTIWDTINLGDNNFNTSIQTTVNDYYEKKSHALKYIKKIVNQETKLTKLDLIEISKENFMSKPYAKLTQKVTDFLREYHDLLIDNVSGNETKLMRCQDIPKKKLFFSEAECTQLRQISAVLEESKFREMQIRLKEKSMPIGISAIFHGVPGTGKTECVYQLAKETGRSIF